MKVAALFVQEGGCYYDLKDVDPWGETRDARWYQGPHPVVAHPPCQRWGKFWAGNPTVIKKTGVRKEKGADGGCFASALSSVRRYGGILEHPEHSHAWEFHGLNKPPRHGGWIHAGYGEGWTCRVEQGQYGHYARKPTWLFAYGVDLPELKWGVTQAQFPPEAIERFGLKKCQRLGEVALKGGGKDSEARIRTPDKFRDLLLSIARSAPPPIEGDWDDPSFGARR